MLWHSISHLQKKLDHLDENCPSNRPNLNCDYFLDFCPSIPTAGQTIATKYCYLYYDGCGGCGGRGSSGSGGGGGGGRVIVVV